MKKSHSGKADEHVFTSTESVGNEFLRIVGIDHIFRFLGPLSGSRGWFTLRFGIVHVGKYERKTEMAFNLTRGSFVWFGSLYG